MTTIEFLRQFRLGGYAVFDFAATFIGIYFLAPLLSKLFLKLRLDIPRQSWLLFALPIGILVHLLVGEMTPMTRDFMDMQGHYVVKILILGLLVFGVRGIKMV